MGVIFVAGCYGVGKSTLLESIFEKTKIPHFSAGMLISEVNDETYGRNKYVTNKKNNQALLIEQIEKKLKTYPLFFLDGHFCILKKGNIPDLLSLDDLAKMHFEKILLLEADPVRLQQNLLHRDKKDYSLLEITTLMTAEHHQAEIFSNHTGTPLYIHHMQYNGYDEKEVIEFLAGVLNG
ncbi:MAG: AAA family ATPase [Alphaproteobacteria bacterium]|nr:AAA family ATPase [Alphaproteobacteria bacterium]